MPTPITETYTIQGISCIWFAWASPGEFPGPYMETTASKPTPIAVPTGATGLTVSATGTWTHEIGTDESNADGVPNFIVGLDDTRYLSFTGASSIKSLTDRVNRLVGIWQHGATVPPTVPTTEFAIGTSWSDQVPLDATFLFLGLHDGLEWSNNTGSQSVTLTWTFANNKLSYNPCQSTGTTKSSPPLLYVGLLDNPNDSCSICGCDSPAPSDSPATTGQVYSCPATGGTQSPSLKDPVSTAQSRANTVRDMLPSVMALAQAGGSPTPVPFSIDPSTGNMGMQYNAPLGATFVPPLALSYNSQAADASVITGENAFGNRWSTNLQGYVQTADQFTASIEKGSGALPTYTLPSGSSTAYQPPGGTLNSLSTPTTDTWIETRPDGFQYNYTPVNASALNWERLSLARWESLTLASWEGLVLGTLGQLSTMANAAGAIWTLSYVPGTMHVASVSAPDGTSTFFSYASGQIQEIGDSASSRASLFSCDASGNLANIFSPSGCQTTFRYDGSNRMTGWVRPDLTCVTYSYDSSSRITNVLWPSGSLTTYSYPGTGATQFTDPNGNISTFIYDDFGSISNIIQPDSTVYTFSWSQRQLTALQSPTISTTTTWSLWAFNYTTVYDGTQRLNSVYQPLKGLYAYNYDSLGRVASLVDELSNTTTLTWNSAFNRTSLIDPLGNITTYSYSSGGQLTATTDPLGNTTTLVLDPVRATPLRTFRR